MLFEDTNKGSIYKFVGRFGESYKEYVGTQGLRTVAVEAIVTLDLRGKERE